MKIGNSIPVIGVLNPKHQLGEQAFIRLYATPFLNDKPTTILASFVHLE